MIEIGFLPAAPPTARAELAGNPTRFVSSP
jgi:hypothetical protein